MSDKQLKLFDLPEEKPKVILGEKSLRAYSKAYGSTTRNSKGGTITQNDNNKRKDGYDAVRRDPGQSWATLELQRKNLYSTSTEQLFQIAIDLSPNMKRGFSDFLRFTNPGYDIQGSDQAKNANTEFFNRLEDKDISIDSICNSIFASIFMTGAAFLELVLNKGGRGASTIRVVDSVTADFERYTHPVDGQKWRLYQRQGREKVYLNDNPCIKYIPYDKIGDDPFGTPIMSGGVYASVFLLSVLQDLRRIVASQGLSRVDYSLSQEGMDALIEQAGDIAGDDKKVAAFIEEHINQVREEIEQLQVDEDFIHLDLVTVNYGDTAANKLDGLDTIIRKLERDIIVGIQSIPLLHASNESVAETHANRQLDF